MLPTHEAHLKLVAADRAMEQIGLRTRLFIPPGWTASQGTLIALPRNGFRLLADHGGIVDLVRGTSMRSRVLGLNYRPVTNTVFKLEYQWNIENEAILRNDPSKETANNQLVASVAAGF